MCSMLFRIPVLLFPRHKVMNHSVLHCSGVFELEKNTFSEVILV